MAKRVSSIKTKRKYDAFVSHAPEDALWVGAFVDDLQTIGRSIKSRRDLESGRSYDESAGDFLRDSYALLLVISPYSVLSQQVKSDLQRWKNASPTKRKLIPIDIWGAPYPDDMISNLTPIDLTSYDEVSYWEKVYRLARDLSTRSLASLAFSERMIPKVNYWDVEGPLCIKILKIVRFHDELKALWRTYEGSASPTALDHASAYKWLDTRGGLTSLQSLLAAMDELRKFLEFAHQSVGQQASDKWWRDAYASLDEAHRAKADRDAAAEAQAEARQQQRERELQEKQRPEDEKQRLEQEAAQNQEPDNSYNDLALDDLSDLDYRRAQRRRAKRDSAKEGEARKLRQSQEETATMKTWDEVLSEKASYSVNVFEDVVLCMHPQSEREWRSAVPNANIADLHCLTIGTPEGAWHKEGMPDATLWRQVFDDLCRKVQAACSRKAKRVHLVAMTPVSLGALLGSLIDPQNHQAAVYQLDNVQGQKDRKAWRPYGPAWPASPGKRLEPFFEVPPGLDVKHATDDSHVAVVINITGKGDPEVCSEAVRSQANDKPVHIVQLKALHSGQGAIAVPADVDRAADEIDTLIQQLAEGRPKGTLHLFYYGPIAVIIRGARSLKLRRVPIIVYESMQYEQGWHWVPVISFPEGRLLIGQSVSMSMQQNPKGGQSPQSQVPPAFFDGVPTRRSLRQLLMAVLRTDDDLNHFCIDHFKSVHTRFAGGMNRLARENLLLECIAEEEVLSRLQEHNSAAVTKHWHLLVSSEPSKKN